MNEVFPRRAVFVGTVNPEDDVGYLRDRTGNRRFWPVKLEDKQIDIEGITAYREQLFAEAVVAFRAGEVWWLDRGEAAIAEVQAQERTKAPRFVEPIWSWWSQLSAVAPAPSARLGALWKGSEISTDIIGAVALKLSADRIDDTVRRDIGVSMSRLGFTRRRDGAGSRPYLYAATPSMLAAIGDVSTGTPSQCFRPSENSVPLPS